MHRVPEPNLPLPRASLPEGCSDLADAYNNRVQIVQGPEVVVGKEGVVIGRGLDPKGIVRVASEEWKASTSDGSSLPAGARVVVTRLDGLALTVDAANDEGATAGTAPAEGGRNT